MPTKPITAYPSVELQKQNGTPGPGLDAKLTPAPPEIWTALEFSDDDGNPYLKEYEGHGLLKDKAILITGGDSGIGRSCAILMAREGADITIVYLPEEEEDAQWTRGQIEKAGRTCLLHPCDVKEEKNCKAAVDAHMKKFGKLNTLVNNSAMQEMSQDLRDIDLGVVEKTFRTNVLAMFAFSKFALQVMKRGSNIVNSASVATYMGNPTLCDYSSTKGAIGTFTRALAQQQAAHGIRVNSVAPGIIWTPLQPATKGAPAEAMEGLGVGMCPLNRPGMPVECATAYVYLASPLSGYCTGECIHVAGGLEMQG